MRRFFFTGFLLTFFFAALSARGKWGDEYSDFHFARDRVFDLLHTRLEISFNETERSLSGRVTHRLVPLLPEQRYLILDAVELKIENISDPAGNSLPFEQSDGKLKIDLGLPYKTIDTFSVTIAYSANPRAGVYFVQPDAKYPRKRRHVWTQSEDEYARYWMPTGDYPNDKATSEVLVTVPEKYLAVSNGELVSDTRSGGKRTFHWRENVPHVTYLTSIVAGEYEMYSDTATLLVDNKVKIVPLLYYYPPGEREKSVRSFGKTAKMMRFFSQKIGVPYPYEKYSQATVDEFIHGGMENISATTQTERTLHDRLAHQDYKSEGLVAHELAHQWWGDLLTCRDWSQAWLNEGFASYFDALFQEYDLGPDEMPVKMGESRTSYLNEDKTYRRPIVTNYYSGGFDMFDRHTFAKGAWVLHMLRVHLGEESWWKGIKHYSEQHYAQNVVTADFQKAMEEASGKNLDWFFQQWVYKGGYPELKIRSRWNDTAKAIQITIEQVQKTDSLTPLFRFKLPVVVTAGRAVADTFWVSQKEQVFQIPTPEQPTMIEVDPRLTVLKTIDFERSEEALRFQLKNSPIAESRREAAEALGKFRSDETAEALSSSAKADKFYDVRRQAALALGEIRGAKAKAGLLSALADADSRVRRSAVTALSKFTGDGDVVSKLRQVFAADTSYAVVAEVMTAVAKLAPTDALAFLQKGLLRSSHNEVITASALRALSELKDPKLVDVLINHSAYGRPFPVRSAAAEGLGKLGAHLRKEKSGERLQERIRSTLIGLLSDSKYDARRAAIAALGTLEDPETLDGLEKFEKGEPHYQLVKAARRAAEKIRRAHEEPESLEALKSALDRLEEAAVEMRGRIEALEKKGP